jgi:hypothetical protein
VIFYLACGIVIYHPPSTYQNRYFNYNLLIVLICSGVTALSLINILSPSTPLGMLSYCCEVFNIPLRGAPRSQVSAVHPPPSACYLIAARSTTYLCAARSALSSQHSIYLYIKPYWCFQSIYTPSLLLDLHVYDTRFSIR